MTLDKWLVLIGGAAAIAFVVWFFWMVKKEGVKAALTPSGYQEMMILVKGGYTPDAVRVEAGKPVRLKFRREETSSCSEMVIFPDFGKSAQLPSGQVVSIELMPKEPGTYQWQCQMGMLTGKLIVEKG
ncbi:MAG: cupredoxin domain-containing protein [Firmicutes bacterium]|nr:cupredoxin domain-containing protein [Bacillota bacterium]